MIQFERKKDNKTLYIIYDRKIILQTNASNGYWSEVLIEDKDGQNKIYGYTSGKLKDGTTLSLYILINTFHEKQNQEV